MIVAAGRYHSRCVCMLRLSTDLTSLTNRSASSIGKRLRRAVSVGLENHDVIGNALSATQTCDIYSRPLCKRQLNKIYVI